MLVWHRTFVCLSLLVSVKSFNILVIFGHPGKSHYDAFGDLFYTLASRGHNLTLLTHVKPPTMENIRHIPFGDKGPMTHVIDLKNTSSSRLMHYYSQVKLLTEFADVYCLHSLQQERFKAFLKEDNQFDLILMEMFNTNCYDGLIRKFNAPVIGLSSCVLLPWYPQRFGTPTNPAYIQNVFSGFHTPMNFFSRVENTLVQLYTVLSFEYLVFPKGKELSKRYTGYEVADPRNNSLILVNTHYTIHGARPLSPNVIEVGGIHVDNKTRKPLSQTLESWLNDADEGVIYFNLGSMIKGDTFPEEPRKAFIKTFAKLPQKVLWKWENGTMPDKPNNVMLAKWLSQFDVLCHPNVKLFISHGGLLGTIEAFYCGVPIIVMPHFGDQMHNAFAMKNFGNAVMLDLQSATEETISEALKKALNPESQQRAKSRSELFKDRPLSPKKTAVFWVEHVGKHRGALHMKSQAVDLPFYQYYLLDVILFLFLILVISFYIIIKFFKFILCALLFDRIYTKDKLL